MSVSTDPAGRLLIPGKLFTGIVLTLLAISLAVLAPVSLRFEYAQDRLEETRQVWPQAALQLESRYQIAEQLSTNGLFDLPAEWSSLHEKFQQSVLYDEQRPYSRLLEQVLTTAMEKRPGMKQDDRDRLMRPLQTKQYQEFDAAESRLQMAHSDFLGRFTSTLFRLKLP